MPDAGTGGGEGSPGSIKAATESPQWGPEFLPLGSGLYRLEYAAATVAILVVLIGWRMVVLQDFRALDIFAVVLWFLLPDVVAFVPIGLSRSPKGSWPTWGSTLYNFMHSLLTWGGVFLIAWVLTGAVMWPLLGWAAHITADRAAGYHLRAGSQRSSGA